MEENNMTVEDYKKELEEAREEKYGRFD